MAIIPEKYLDLLQKKKAFASLATAMADGSPQVTPVWFDYKDGVLRVNTAKGRVKAHTLREGAPVALAIVDPDDPYRYVQVRGRVRRVTEGRRAAHRFAREEISRARQVHARPAGRGPPAVRNRADVLLWNGLSAPERRIPIR